MSNIKAPKQVVDQFGNSYELIQCIGEGAEGAVYRTNVEGKLVKLVYIAASQQQQWIDHKRWLMRQKKEKFPSIILPQALLTGEHIGYVMDEVTNHLPLVEFIVKPADLDLHQWYNEETGGIKKRVDIAKNIAKCFRQLHVNGLAFSDISPTNILVSKTSSSIWIIDPDNITAPNRFDHNIIGTPRYIAPELFKESRSVSSITDTYAYGILMFEMFRLGHPYIGDELSEATPEEEQKAFEGHYPYIEHPEDDSNASTYHLPAPLIFNDVLNQLFKTLFVDGQQNFMKRPSLLEFYRAFSRVNDHIHVCYCGASFILQEYAICPWCDEKADNLLYVNCVQMSSVTDSGLATGKLNKSKEVRGQLLLQENKWVVVYQHHFNEEVLVRDNHIIGALYKKGNTIVYINRANNKKEQILIDGKTKSPKAIKYDERIELKPNQIIILEKLNAQQAGISDVIEKATLLNYLELSIEVKV